MQLKSAALSWRWHSWLCAIISGVNFLGIFFFFPETRYHRSIDAAAETGSVLPIQSAEKPSSDATVEHVDTNDSSQLTGAKKTYFQELSIWSGTAKKSYFNHLIRPFPLLAYPAVAWAVFTCKSPSLCIQFGEKQMTWLTVEQTLWH